MVFCIFLFKTYFEKEKKSFIYNAFSTYDNCWNNYRCKTSKNFKTTKSFRAKSNFVIFNKLLN